MAREEEKKTWEQVFKCLLDIFRGFPGGSVVKNLPANARDAGLIPGSGRPPGEGNGTPLQYSFLENPNGQRSLVGCSPWGHKRVGRDLVTKQQQQYLR